MQRFAQYLSGFMLLLPITAAFGQSSPSVEERLRFHAGEIAAESIPAVALPPGSRVTVDVSGRGAAQIVGNAFAEHLRRSGFIPLVGESAQADARLDAAILDQRVTAVELGNGTYARTVRTVLECRWTRQTGEVVSTGPFERATVDTVNEVRTGPIDNDQPSDGFLEKLVTPMVVVGSVVLMVYLLFTVRS